MEPQVFAIRVARALQRSMAMRIKTVLFFLVVIPFSAATADDQTRIHYASALHLDQEAAFGGMGAETTWADDGLGLTFGVWWEHADDWNAGYAAHGIQIRPMHWISEKAAYWVEPYVGTTFMIGGGSFDGETQLQFRGAFDAGIEIRLPLGEKSAFLELRYRHMEGVESGAR